MKQGLALLLSWAPLFLKTLRPYRGSGDAKQSGNQWKAGSRKHLKSLDEVETQPAKKHPGENRGVRGKHFVESNYSFSEAGSDKFLGDFLFSTPISSCAAGGTATAPLRTIASASTFLL